MPHTALIVSAAFVTLVALRPSVESAFAAPAPASEGQTVEVSQPRVTTSTDPNASQVRQEFFRVLQKYPPSLGRILKLDPGLLSNDAYLAPYPLLTAFLKDHPEVRRSPAYYLEQVDVYSGYRRSEEMQMWEVMMAGVAIFVMTVTMLAAFGWIVRTLVDYRRWHRLSKTQAEAHTKLLDRFSANEELLAYVQSPAGSRFLQSAPIALDPGARSMGAPFARILWSVQAGVVLAMAGVGLHYVSSRVDETVREPIFTVAVIALSLGAGFIISAFVSYVLSRRLGLLDGPAVAGRETPGA